jgi:uncharacterized protein (DUF1330 family)
VGERVPPTDGTVTLCCLLWARDGASAALSEYEDTVLALLPRHGAAVLSRVISTGEQDAPHEVQLFSFPSAASLDAYLQDSDRAALADVRDRVVGRTQLFPVRLR